MAPLASSLAASLGFVALALLSAAYFLWPSPMEPLPEWSTSDGEPVLMKIRDAESERDTARAASTAAGRTVERLTNQVRSLKADNANLLAQRDAALEQLASADGEGGGGGAPPPPSGPQR